MWQMKGLSSCPWLLLAMLFTWQHAAAAEVKSRQCRVTSVQTVSLLDCLRDPVAEEILVEPGAAVGDVAALKGAPLHLSRNVTIRKAGDATHTDDWPVLDLNYTPAAVQICSTCVVTLSDLVIKRERRGTGPVYDFFIGQPGSRLRSINTIRVWEMCTPGSALLKLVKSLRRSPLFPNSTAPQEAGLVENITWKGKVYPNSYRSGYISFDVPANFDEGSGTDSGGFAQMTANSTRLCENYVSPECLAVMSGDACIQQAISAMNQAAPKHPQGLTPSATIAIVVSLVVATLLGAALVVWGMNHKHMGLGPLGGPKGQRGKLQRYSSTGVSCGSDDYMSGGNTGSAGPRLGKPLGRTTGWAIMDTQTAGCMGHVEDSGIELGPLIGAGSFGKVFKGRWNSRDVAVKVIEHSGTSAEAVQQEMSMMMSFQHPNIVRAFHCITYVHNLNNDSECSGSFAFQPSGGVGSASSGGSRSAAATPSGVGVHPADSMTAAAAAAGMAAGTTARRIPSGHSSKGAGTATSSGGAANTDTSAAAAAAGACQCPAASGDAVLTIHEGRACCHGQPASCQCSSTGAATTTSPPEASTGSPKVRFGAAGGSGGAAAAAAAAAAEGGRGSGGGCVCSAAGSSSSLHAVPMPTDSLGSSVDCRCVAGELRRTHSGARSTKSAKSVKEPARRYESWLVLEFCDRGSLSHYLSQWPPPVEALVDGDSMLRALQLLLHAAQGLQELHGQNVVHGDLNARNVLVSSCAEEPSGVQGKLADLGLSRTIRQHQTHRTTTTIGTMNHMPPEMLRSGQMSVCADTYALGIMMWELYTGEEAFQRLQHPGQFFETVVLQDLRPVIPPGMPSDYQLLMQHCWATEPSARAPISRVLECLQYMVRQRQQQQQAADGTTSDPGPLPVLLSMPPPSKQQPWQHQMQRAAALKAAAMGSGLPSGSPRSGILITPTSSNTPLPVLGMHQPIEEDTWAEHDTQRQQQQPGMQQKQQSDKQQGATAAAAGGAGGAAAAAAGAGAGGIGFFRRSLSGRRTSGSTSDAAASRTPDAADTSREGSGTHQGGSSPSGRPPTFMQGLAQSMRASGMVLREMSFDRADSRGPSWSTRQGSQSSSINEHPWFV